MKNVIKTEKEVVVNNSSKTSNEFITSLELLEQINEFRKLEKDNYTELRHDTLLSIIRDEFEEEISLQKILESKYTNSRGREYPLFNLTYSQAKQVLVRESKFVRKHVIQRLEELEKQAQNGFYIPQTYGEALKLAYEQQLLIEEQNKVIEIQKPKALFYDTVVQSEDAIDVGSVAKVLNYKGIGRNKLFEILRNEEILMNNNQPYQKYVDLRWFKVVETSWVNQMGDAQIYLKTVVYQKGVEGISKVLDRLGFVKVKKNV